VKKRRREEEKDKEGSFLPQIDTKAHEFLGDPGSGNC
jgi:hypothetical protein